jgi:hypothetical protein
LVEERNSEGWPRVDKRKIRPNQRNKKI